jgi:ribonuclease HII
MLQGLESIIGIDEAGRGPLAGPVVAAAAVFPADYAHKKINDSKKLSKKIRDSLFSEIQLEAIDWAIVAVSPWEIDKRNIREATKWAMSLACEAVRGDRVIIDGNMLIRTPRPQEAIVRGDALHVQISAASILAKVWRDKHMEELSEYFPEYGFALHNGYPTKAHREAVARFGPCPIHRKTFAGVREYLGQTTLKQIPLPTLPYEELGYCLYSKFSSQEFKALRLAC